MKKKIYK